MTERFTQFAQRLSTTHLALRIDLGDLKTSVLVRYEMTVKALLTEIGLKYRSGKSANHALYLNNKLLEANTTIRDLGVATGTLLVFSASQQTFAQSVVTLQVLLGGPTIELTSFPAIIGRTKDAVNDLAVNLQEVTNGQTASRRHAKLTNVDGQLFIENIADRPTEKAIKISLPTASGEIVLDNQLRCELIDGATFTLGKVNLRLELHVASLNN